MPGANSANYNLKPCVLADVQDMLITGDKLSDRFKNLSQETFAAVTDKRNSIVKILCESLVTRSLSLIQALPVKGRIQMTALAWKLSGSMVVPFFACRAGWRALWITNIRIEIFLILKLHYLNHFFLRPIGLPEERNSRETSPSLNLRS